MSSDELTLLVQPERRRSYGRGHDVQSFQYTEPSAELKCSFLLVMAMILLSPVLLLMFFVFLLNSLCWKKKMNSFAYRATKFNNSVVRSLIENVGFYNPPWWYNNHLGTLFSFGASPMLLFERQIYHQADGTIFAVDWYPKSPCNLKPTQSKKV